VRADRPGPATRARVWTLDGETEVRRRDSLVTEEPLEIRLSAGGRTQTVAVTMRTPGNDFELATGFLHAEGLLPAGPHQVSYCADVERPDQRFNVVTVETDGPALDAPVRSGIVSSACGVCGSASLDALRERGLSRVVDGVTVPVDVLYGLALDALGDVGGARVVDGYAGIGVLSTAIAETAREVVCIEENPVAVHMGRLNATMNGVDDRLRYVCAPVEKALAQVAAEAPVDAVVLDPPRAGCEGGVTGWLALAGPQRVVYVSCDPATLARDLHVLASSGPYQVAGFDLVDMFPQTHHVESVVELRRRR